MADSETIKSFLVALGFDVDKAGLKAFSDAIVSTSKQVIEFAAATEAAAVAVVASVAKMASGMEALYFASQRTGAAVENIEALGYAASQVGGSVGGARSALEGLASFLRNNPQGESFLKGLGVSSHDAAVQMQQLGAVFRSMPIYAANNYAKLLGIDDITMLSIRSGEFDKFAEDHRRRVREAGVDEQAAASDSHSFMLQLRGLGDAFSVLADKVTQALTKRAGVDIQHFREFVESHFDQISKVIVRFAKVILDAADMVTHLVLAVAAGIGEIIDVFMSMDSHSRGLIEAFALIVAAWRVLNTAFLSSPIGIIAMLILALGTLWDDYKTWKRGGSSLIDWAAWEPDILKAKAAIIWLGEKLQWCADQVGGWQNVLIGFAAVLAGSWLLGVLATFATVASTVAALTASIGLLGVAIPALALAAGDYLAGDVPSYPDVREAHPTEFGKWTYDHVAIIRQANNWVFGHRESNPGGAAVAGGAWRGAEAGSIIPPNQSVDSISKDGAANEAFDFWKSKGFSDEGAAAEVASEHRESGFDPAARGDPDANGNKQAAGLFQWHKPRRDAILAATGIDVWTANRHDQHEAAYREQRDRIDAGAGRAFDAAIHAATTFGATTSIVHDFERSADQPHDQAVDQQYADALLRAQMLRTGPLMQSLSRGGTAPSSSPATAPSVSSSTTINVNGAGDPQATAKAVATQQDSVHQRLIRNLAPAAN